jgi:UDP-2-acetamido-3-amino-2,3-dideoxy-glucuronate N-acetyltransferase
MFHPTSIVESKNIGSGTRVWAFAHVLPGACIGSNVNIGDHAFVEGGAVIGDNVTLKNAVCVWAGVTIEDDVFVGPNVTFTNDRHPRSPRMAAAHARYASPSNWLVPTRVGRGCSIGAAATICPGVVLGPYCMIAAGAVVTRDVAPFSLVAGVPAKPVAEVCTCGQVLTGSHSVSVCDHCGETPQARLQRIAEQPAANPVPSQAH